MVDVDDKIEELTEQLMDDNLTTQQIERLERKIKFLQALNPQ